MIDAANENYVSFYVIHLPLFEPRNDRLEVRPPSKGFRDLAEKTGGKYFLATERNRAALKSQQVDLAPMFQAIEDDLKKPVPARVLYQRVSEGWSEASIFRQHVAHRHSILCGHNVAILDKQEFFINLKPGTTTLPR